MTRDERRQAWRTIRRGEAITDTHLAAATLEWVRSTGGRCAWGVLFDIVFLGTIVARTTLAMLAEEWTYAAVQLLGLDFFMLLIGGATLFRQKARQTERATMLRQGW